MKIMKFNLGIIGNLKPEKGALETLHTYSFKNGNAFPGSYIDFVEQYGYGLSLGLFIIYIPMGSYGDSFMVRSAEIIGTYQNVLADKNELWFDLEPDATYEMLESLIPFAMSENGHYLFWDTAKNNGNEFSIYITDFRGLGFTKIADNLYEFFDVMTDKMKGREKIIDLVLPATFKPFEMKE